MPLIAALIAGGLGFALVFSHKLEHQLHKHAEDRVNKEIEKNKKKGEEFKEKAQERAKEQKKKIATFNEKLTVELEKQKEVIEEKEALAKKRGSRITQLEGTIKNLAKEHKKLEKDLEAQSTELLNAVAKQAKLKPEKVIEEMKTNYEHDWIEWKDGHLHNLEAQMEDEIPEIAKSMLKSTLQRYTARSSVDQKEFSFTLKKNAMKGPLIGQGGQNILYFEQKAEVNVIFDYEPNLVTVSCFNMYRRAVAMEALKKLSFQKKINEQVIDEHLEKATNKMDKIIMDFGRRAAKMMGLKDLEDELVYLIGRLEYRTSYGQNIWWHSLEVAYFSRMLAEAIGVNIDRAKEAGFYHDLGKAIDHDLETSVGHDYLTKDLMDKFQMCPLTVHAAFAHHDAVPCKNPEDYLVKASDAMSAARPGARQQTMEKYLKLVRELVERAQKVIGVKKAYTVNAGREVRAVINEKAVDDSRALEIAKEIADDIEANMGYPGTIKINAIRIFQAEDVADPKKLRESRNTAKK